MVMQGEDIIYEGIIGSKYHDIQIRKGLVLTFGVVRSGSVALREVRPGEDSNATWRYTCRYEKFKKD